MYAVSPLYFIRWGWKGAIIMRGGHDYLLITNNPLVVRCMGDCYPIEFVEGGYRDVLVKARDMVYIGHTLYTHPLAGSVKPNETVYRSIAVSKNPHAFSQEQAEMMSNSIMVSDKFLPKKSMLTDELLKDFQLVDYTLIAGAMEFDAAAGLAK